MRLQSKAVVLVAIAVVATTAVPLAAGAIAPTQQDVAPTQAQVDQPGNETQAGNGTQAENETGTFEIVSLSAPDSAAPNSTVTVIAFVENTGSSPAAEAVEFRVGGDVVDRARLALDAGETDAVGFSLDTEGLESGTYIHGVYTEGAGATADLTISESFLVSDLDAPANASAGSTVSVAATVTNPNDFETTQRVAFRFAGTPLVTEELTLDAGETREFLADADTTGVAPGSYVHGVFTRDTGQVARIDITEMGDGVGDDNVTDGNATDGNVTDGNVTDGNATDGNMTDGGVADDNMTDDNATDGNATDGGVVDGNATDGNMTDGAATDGNASVSFADQSSAGTTVTVDSATLPEGGFVTIHDSGLLNDAVIDSVIGVSEYFEAGTYENVTVTLFDVPGADFAESSLATDETLIAMPHLDTNANQTYDFVATNGTDDGPYVADGEAVVDIANVTVEPATADGTATSGDNATTTPDDNATATDDANATETGTPTPTETDS